jgi:RNA polymerase sigma factor (TIGR02999 family)
MPSLPADASTLPGETQDGVNQSGIGELFSAVYEELCQLARMQCRIRQGAHTLNANALVHEAYIRMARHGPKRWRNHGHFLAVSAMAMRQILSNNVRGRRAAKRGGDCPKVPLDDLAACAIPSLPDENLDELITLDAALQKLGRTRKRQCRIIECRFFADLSVEETADVLGLSPATVKRDWRLASAWLRHEIDGGGVA